MGTWLWKEIDGGVYIHYQQRQKWVIQGVGFALESLSVATSISPFPYPLWSSRWLSNHLGNNLKTHTYTQISTWYLHLVFKIKFAQQFQIRNCFRSSLGLDFIAEIDSSGGEGHSSDLKEMISGFVNVKLLFLNSGKNECSWDSY